jgi:hypothetical protein
MDSRRSCEDELLPRERGKKYTTPPTNQPTKANYVRTRQRAEDERQLMSKSLLGKDEKTDDVWFCHDPVGGKTKASVRLVMGTTDNEHDRRDPLAK